MFDIDSLNESLQPIQFKLDGKVYTGKYLSEPQFRKFLIRGEELDSLDPKDEEQLREYQHKFNQLRQDFFRALWPWKLRYIFGNDPVKLLERQLWKNEAFGNFFALNLAPMIPKNQMTSQTNGKDSPKEASQTTNEEI